MFERLDIIIPAAIILLTNIVLIAIIIKSKKLKINLKPLKFNQSSLHAVIKDMLPKNSELRQRVNSQSKMHEKEKNIKIIYTPDQKAYWVVNNIFYCADLIDGEFDPSTGKPIDTDGLSKKEIEKLLFILDNLKNG